MSVRRFVKQLVGAAVAFVAVLALALPVAANDWEFPEPGVDASLFEPLMAPILPLLQGPGSTTLISQIGVDGTANISAIGAGNLGLIVQGGANNVAYQAIEGQGSAALLLQGGTNNSVLQAIKGDNDFQAIAVSGSNNQVAFIQHGNNLAGALDVTGSQNSSVVALQTNGSAQYLMPTGLRGLNNQVVVIVPGRMYVFNKP